MSSKTPAAAKGSGFIDAASILPERCMSRARCVSRAREVCIFEVVPEIHRFLAFSLCIVSRPMARIEPILVKEMQKEVGDSHK